MNEVSGRNRSLAIVGSTVAGRAQERESRGLRDLEPVIARQIAEGGPTENVGLENSIRGSVPLEAYRDSLESGELRMREVDLAPGARVRVHGHNERPAIAYVLEGEIVEHRNDSEQPIVRRQGDSYLEGPGIVHWLENVSGKRVRVVTAEILPGDRQ